MRTSFAARAFLVTLTTFLLAGITTFFLLSQPAAPATASTVPCNASAVVSDATDGGEGVTVTLSLTGSCTEAPMVLTAVTAAGKQTVATRTFAAGQAGTRTAQVTFVPDHGVSAYEVTVQGTFAATLTP